MTPSETRDAARVMLDSLKKGAIVQYRRNGEWTDYPLRDYFYWNWDCHEYRVRFIKPKEKRK